MALLFDELILQNSPTLTLSNAIGRKRENAAAIRTLILEGADINARDSRGFTPLLLASKYGKKTIVQLLIDSGANVDSSECDFKRTLLHYSAGYGWTDIVQYVLKNAYDLSSTGHRDDSVPCEKSACPIIHVRDIEGRTALHLASLRGHLEVVKCLVEEGANLFGKNEVGETPLHDASRKGYTEIVQYLLGRGARTDVRDKSGCVALHEASVGGHLEVVMCLAAQGTDINIKNEYGETPLHVATYRGHVKVAEYLVDTGADIDARDDNDETALLMASNRLYIDLVILLINRGASIDCCDCNKETVLHYAARHGWIKLVEYLVMRTPVSPFIFPPNNIDSCEGSSCPTINRRTIDGRTPLHVAIIQGHMEVVKFLVCQGADIDGRNENGETGLIEATTMGRFEIVKFLVAAKADPNIRDNDGNTALHEALFYQHLNIIMYLLENGADMHVKNYKGIAPVLIAARFNLKGVVELLVNCGVNLDGCDGNGGTMLHFAAQHGWVEIVMYLVEIMPDLNARDSDGDTALHYACRALQLHSVQYLLHAGARWDIANKYDILPLDCIKQHCSIDKYIKLFVTAGAYITPDDYSKIVDRFSPQIHLLQDVEFCCRTIVNKFNVHDLPALYKLPASACLPRIEKMTIASNSEVARGIERTVKHEIQRNGYCNVLEIRPISLSFLSVRSVLKYYDKKATVPQNQLKRLVALDSENEDQRLSKSMRLS